MDKLTDIYNRNYLLELFVKEFSKCLRHNINLVCLIIDLDNFKETNDTYGHLAGDYVLKTVSQLIKNKIRSEDIFGRYGGDEFLLILPYTSLNDGKKVAEKIKNKIKKKQFKNKGVNFRVTFSVGISKLDQSMKNIDDLIEKADISLYKSKKRR
ncbi:GGDEF domain-containing protein (plasmid) [Fusobacteria bacterium ZRK30]|nr:GGDEF domain-containing protein [Fusobacteria bacterium ZRK30]